MLETADHYSGLKFNNVIVRGGNETFLSPTGIPETGHTGNGCIVIKTLFIFNSSCIINPMNHLYLSLLFLTEILFPSQ